MHPQRSSVIIKNLNSKYFWWDVLLEDILDIECCIWQLRALEAYLATQNSRADFSNYRWNSVAQSQLFY